MLPKTKKTFDYLLESGQNEYKTLFEKVSKLQALDPLIKQHLPQPLADHCRLANLRKGKIVLAVDSPVWATKLRFCSLELLTLLRQQPRFAGIAGIDICVAPEVALKQEKVKVMPKRQGISAVNRQMLVKLAESVVDERLKAVLLRWGEK